MGRAHAAPEAFAAEAVLSDFGYVGLEPKRCFFFFFWGGVLFWARWRARREPMVGVMTGWGLVDGCFLQKDFLTLSWEFHLNFPSS